MTTRVGVLGAAGRMGAEVCRAVTAAQDMELVAGVDAGDDMAELERAEVVVHFTTPDAVLDNIRYCCERGIHSVVGTSGFTPIRLQTVQDILDRSGTEGVGVLVAPNFGIGAVLMMQFAARAAPFFESVEIIELHHPNKVDAPSGTARQTAAVVAGAREAAGVAVSPDATVADDMAARGVDVAGVRIHSVRLRGLVAHQEVLLGSPGEELTIRHDSFDRASFMPGVLLGIRAVLTRPGLTVGIDELMESS